ncbi:hypothetical protein P255_01205 [Acinetobacter brisouii CIP 110357]|uniref:Uncharacterized protein n=1 Tax=Acinetobacter brisouii CIP 110357 TaxID=1341683 RepID=V2UT59_9GAMM|nr:hypothetical protein [Acinetobacter brisouii]ENV48324.1 hypothetical protein F954_01392 [Acinetobacter brisouii ANC 4119]ESK51776.1 hypothetical protein P255_01205 [Acinetobacter brisouii CIP 110357]
MSSIRNYLGKIDTSTSEGMAQKETLDILVQLGNAKADFFQSKIEMNLQYAQDKSDSFPIQKVIYNFNSVRCFSANEFAELRSTINSEVKMFLSGVREAALSAISSLVYFELDMLLNRPEHSYEIEARYLAFEGESAIRIDMVVWYQNINIYNLKDKPEKILTVVALVSAIDTKKMNLLAFLNMYQAELSQGGASQEVIANEIAFAKDVLDKPTL